MLTPSAVANAKPRDKPYKLTDERGMFLLVNPNGSKLWRLKYRRPGTGKENLLALGAYPDVTLKRAREKREDARTLLADGIDPSEQRKTTEAAAADSFSTVAGDWLNLKAADWAPGHLAKERLRLEVHAFPWIGRKPIGALGVDDIAPVIRRVVDAGHIEQAHRLREELSRIFRYAIATEKAKTDPAHALSEVLPKRRKGGFPSIVKPEELGELLRAMDGFTGTLPVRCALRLAPYLFCRPGELRQMEWAHLTLDGDEPQCVVPPSIRKMHRLEKEAPDAEPHIIPLSVQAVAILKELQPLTGRRRHVFPGARDPKRSMSEAAVNAALARIGYKGLMTGHGFRHTASTRLEELGWSDAAIEAQLSHRVIGVRGKYKRDQYLRALPERRQMVQQWADYLDSLRDGNSKVVPIRAA